MKTLKHSLIIFLILSSSITLTLSKSKNKHKSNSHSKKNSPKGLDLQNHFGESNVEATYGPTTKYSEHIESNLEQFTPQIFEPNRRKFQSEVDEHLKAVYPQNQLNPTALKSGELTNNAPTASRLINPDIAAPKVSIDAEYNHPALVKDPTFYGFRKEYVPVQAYDNRSGQIVEDKIVVDKPVYGWEDNIKNVSTRVNHTVDLRTGEAIQSNDEKVLHGVDRDDTENRKQDNRRRLRRF